ncbi:MAG: TIGR03790 family protein [Kiritimatiellae bacterium]|nr:TIGR03790 family protein [Kiritimatiellia bacterium]MDD5522342.1 TIGR03790 family protein [Kiritimatiellia bacterium]
MRARLIIIIFFAVFAGSAYALGPHEVLVLVNEKSADSIEIAKEYVRLRNIPEKNVIRLNLPGTNSVPSLVVTSEDFTNFIWNPALKEMAIRGIDNHILAWIYSVDFPTTINFNPAFSIQGLTFLRNKLPDSDSVKKGTYISPLFAGPDNPAANAFSSQTFDVLKEWLDSDMPLPSMMLGYTGEGGNTKNTILQRIQTGVMADGITPEGNVYFITGADVRAKCREWQYPKVVKELRNLNVMAFITNSFPVGGQKIIGLMCGSAVVNPMQGENIYLPGSMADHLTSAAAIFGGSDQTKLTAWIEAGATASAGTVTEPFSIWTKFPCARFFTHYAVGCTMIESFYQSIRCPLQILLVGDPLVKPWAPKGEVVLTGLEKETFSGVVKVRAEVQGEQRNSYRKFMFLLDGKVVGHDKILELNTAGLSEGEHMVMAVAYKTGFVRNQVLGEKKIIIRK